MSIISSLLRRLTSAARKLNGLRTEAWGRQEHLRGRDRRCGHGRARAIRDAARSGIPRGTAVAKGAGDCVPDFRQREAGRANAADYLASCGAGDTVANPARDRRRSRHREECAGTISQGAVTSVKSDSHQGG
jgi:hypothetical protein